jgi:hypothetical protein
MIVMKRKILFIIALVLSVVFSPSYGENLKISKERQNLLNTFFTLFENYTNSKGTDYTSRPNLVRGYAGKLSDKEKKKALDTTNCIRAMCNLKPVAYFSAGDPYVQQASLIIVANKKPIHRATPNMKFYTAAGKQGCRYSNLFYGGKNYTTEYVVAGYFRDERVLIAGHRQYLLDPFLHRISYGRVDGRYYTGAAILIYTPGPLQKEHGAMTHGITDLYNDTELTFVAYPYKEMPWHIFNSNCSLTFTLITDKQKRGKNRRNIDLLKSDVFIKREDGNKILTYMMTLRSVTGLPTLVWKIRQKDYKWNMTYNVIVKLFFKDGGEKKYRYYFRMVNPGQ